MKILNNIVTALIVIFLAAATVFGIKSVNTIKSTLSGTSVTTTTQENE